MFQRRLVERECWGGFPGLWRNTPPSLPFQWLPSLSSEGRKFWCLPEEHTHIKRKKRNARNVKDLRFLLGAADAAPLETRGHKSRKKPAASAREPNLFSLAAGKATGRNISLKKKKEHHRGRQSEYLHSEESMTDVRPPIGRHHLQIIFIFFLKKVKI